MSEILVRERRPSTPTTPRPAAPQPAPPRPSKVEVAKREGNYLRGTIRDVLDGDAPSFEHDDVQLLKFHGIYQQDDRDARGARRKLGTAKAYQFMVRTRIPGGRLTAEQYLAFDALAREVADRGALRVTTRQTFQFHGVTKGDLGATMRGINDALVTTLAACGDVGRNVMVSPAPRVDAQHRQLVDLARSLSRTLEPESRAYHEVWLDGEKAFGGEHEQLYGATYLPRKLKIGVTLPGDNAVDVHSQDIGLIAIPDATDGIRGVSVLVGGGLGMTHRKADTFARLGTPLGFVATGDAVALVRAITEVFRDHGNRSDRKHARLKYLIEDWGVGRFRAAVFERSGLTLEPWVDPGPLRYEDWLGRHPRGDGRWFFGVHVPGGRIVDRAGQRLATALREIVATVSPSIVLTPTQNLLLDGLDDAGVDAAETALAAYGMAPSASLSAVRRYAMACPALPTCGLALAEAERRLPSVVEDLEAELTTLGLEDVPLTVRMTGCPNGCARPYTADLGLVGRKAGHYDVYIGGRLSGDRLGSLWAENVADADLLDTLRPLLGQWAATRRGDEGLGDFVERVLVSPSLDADQPRHRLTGAKHALRESLREPSHRNESESP